ncbi:hypothetical protein BUALT_Bualt04G0169600 [Buddleja alternifolia]|uniref:KIB1-4 beta-propeller domain-containing protein n=1 Tax=Buddleja alternifolia TaxID=168488 RepID=A0AAV6XXV2_9LAMI|nr:hypothetical protein BUALT_Bualt04G0169600 [Buddleja alternifolia]
MAFLLRWISRKAAVGSRTWNPASRSPTNFGGGYKGGRMMSSVATSTSIPPWLMLPPSVVVEDNNKNNKNMVYKFYSLADDKIISLNKRGGEAIEIESPDDESELKGSSHGWLALFDPRNCDLFLSNPLSRRHIKLPPIHNLPIPEENLEGGYGCVNNVIISCSPDEEECRAMMTFGPTDRLAFCCPGRRSTEWTPIGEPFETDEDGRRTPRSCESFVYSSTEKLFYCVIGYGEFEAWDLQDPSSPRCTLMDVSADEKNYPWAGRSEEELKLKIMCRPLTCLVVDSSSGQLYHVTRHVMEHMAPDGSYVDCFDEGSDMCPYKTIGFDVHKYDPESSALKYMEGSLDGMAFFIGNNHSFAMRASAFPELKPNSIYFTDLDELIPHRVRTPNPPFGGHDIGIFNYEDGTFSPCYYPYDNWVVKHFRLSPTLTELVFSNNLLSGKLPDPSSLSNLQLLDLSLFRIASFA